MDFNQEISWIWEAMRGDYGVMMTIMSWVFALRMVNKLVGAVIIKFRAEKATPDENAFFERIKSRLWYRILSFLLDYLASIKLPGKLGTIGGTGNTDIIKKP